ncbi:hypothetical protein [Bacillus sp. EB01]|uniref:hypothetical protein n=1 Tax=Bacillus sp. EB01 TaxID=1347086 RepID=UPI000A47CA82|nr:hypothetical protein [Bacillus sp. EB01]
MFENFYKDKFQWDFFIKENLKACRILQEHAGIPDELKVRIAGDHKVRIRDEL